MKRIVGVLVFLALLAVSLVVFDYWSFVHRRFEPYDRPARVTILPGASLAAIAAELRSKGVIGNIFWFKVRAQRLGLDRHLQPGTYKFSPAQLPDEILRMLHKGEVELVRARILEGMRMTDIGPVLEKAGVTRSEDFLRACHDTVLIASLGFDPAIPHLEGYLFPDTYHFRPDTAAPEVVRAMVDLFGRNFTAALEEQARALGLSRHEAVTLASIIEKETGAAFERRRISSVFHNRLEKGMRLQTDPSVIYGIENFNGNLTRRDLRTPTLYNTYTNSGLPPTPICSPGLASLVAAVSPEDSDYLYFVSRNDGTHLFTTNYTDHLEGVMEFQRAGRMGTESPPLEPEESVGPPPLEAIQP